MALQLKCPPFPPRSPESRFCKYARYILQVERQGQSSGFLQQMDPTLEISHLKYSHIYLIRLYAVTNTWSRHVPMFSCIVHSFHGSLENGMKKALCTLVAFPPFLLCVSMSMCLHACLLAYVLAHVLRSQH